MNGVKHFHNNENRGIACIGGTCLEDIWGWSRLSWPEGLLDSVKDEKGCYFGCKTTTLESVGLLIPLIAFPERVRGKQVIFKIDNIAVMWGWRKGYVKNDESASEILKAAKYLAGYLGTTIYVEHVGRMYEELACMADELSRKWTCEDQEEKAALEKALYRATEGFLLKWLEDPCHRGDLCTGLLKEVGALA